MEKNYNRNVKKSVTHLKTNKEKNKMILQKNLSRFKLVTFDITDTLLKFKRPPAIQYAKKASDFGYHNVDQIKLAENFRKHFKQMDQLYPNFGSNTNMTWDNWWKKLVIDVFHSTDTSIPNDDIEKIANELIRVFGTIECWVKLPGANELVETMKKHVKKIGVVSNFDPRISEIVKEMCLPEFDFVLDSYRAGVRKPDKRLFEMAIELSNCNCCPSEALHIGNTPKLDYVGAKEAGWSSLLVSGGTDEWKKYSEINSNHVFETLLNVNRALESTVISW